MPTPPQYTLGRTASVVVPTTWNGFDVTSWFGFNYTGLADAGDFVVAWNGIVFNNGEPGDPFYINMVKLDKASWTALFQQLTNLYPLNPFYTAVGLVVDSVGGNVYVLAFNFTIEPSPTTTVFLATLDLATLSLQNNSNIVSTAGNSYWSSGGTEVSTILYFNSATGYVMGVAASFGVVAYYNIGTNTLSYFSGSPSDTGVSESGGVVDSAGNIYRLWVRGASFEDPSILMYVDKIGPPSSPSVTNLSSIPQIARFGSNNNAAFIAFLDEPNNLIYCHVLNNGGGSSFSEHWLAISTVDGSVVSDTTITDSANEYCSSSQVGWKGFTFCDDGSAVFMRGTDGSTTEEPGVEIPQFESDGGWWDGLFTGVDNPFYTTRFTSDLSPGDTTFFYEFDPPPGSLCGPTPPLGDPYANSTGEGGGGTAPVSLNVTSPAPGAFSVTHGLGRTPNTAKVRTTVDPSSPLAGLIQLQSPLAYDATNVYLYASDTGLTAIIYLT